jgi:hypothetical protein
MREGVTRESVIYEPVGRDSEVLKYVSNLVALDPIDDSLAYLLDVLRCDERLTKNEAPCAISPNP